MSGRVTIDNLNDELKNRMSTSVKKNNPELVAELLQVAKSYYLNRLDSDGNPIFFYHATSTVLDAAYQNNTNIDCSTFVGLSIRGIDVFNSPYAPFLDTNINKDEIEEDDDDSEYVEDDSNINDDTWDPQLNITNNKSYSWSLNPFDWSNKRSLKEHTEKPIRTASQMASWMEDMGWCVPLDDDFSQVEPGDIIFWAKKNSDGTWRQPNRYKHISHVALCYSKSEAPTENFPSGYKYKHTFLEVTTKAPYVLNRTLEKCSPDSVVLVCRPDLGSMTPNSIATTPKVGKYSDLNTMFTPGNYILSSDVNVGFPEGIVDGKYMMLKVERTLTRTGSVRNLVQTIIDTKNNKNMYIRTQYCYNVPPASDKWTEWENADVSNKQNATDDNLVTNDKTIVGAINELFQNANNGKELIASAIGEPLNAEDTFQAMSDKINDLLATFKANMTNNGVTVEAGDRFKSLIDKIATMEGRMISYCDVLDAKLNVSRGLAGAGVYNGKIYVMAGMSNSDTHLSDVEYLDYTSNDSTWIQMSGVTMSVPRSNFGVVTIGSKFYCMGGVNSSTSRFGEHAIFDASNNTWSRITGAPPILTTSAVGYNNTEIIMFGYTSDNTWSLVDYTISTNKFTTITVAGHSYNHFYGDLKYVNNLYYNISGRNNTATYFKAIGGIEYYDLSTGKFTPCDGHMIFPVVDSANCVYNGYIYCFGGRMGNTAPVDFVQRFNLSTSTWEVLNVKLNTPRYGAAHVLIDNKFYCIGGFGSSDNTLDTIEVCDLSKI